VATYTLIMSYSFLLKLNLIKALSLVTHSTDYRINFIFLCKARLLMNQSESERNVFKTPPPTNKFHHTHIYICIYIYKIFSQIQLIIGLSVLNVGKYCIIFYCPSAVVSSWRCYRVMKHVLRFIAA
jgi:hypothetical protein